MRWHSSACSSACVPPTLCVPPCARAQGCEEDVLAPRTLTDGYAHSEPNLRISEENESLFTLTTDQRLSDTASLQQLRAVGPRVAGQR